ncbi:MAG: hypothetical protein ACRD3B_14620, partial [Candidatus Sulfotelmatobacter sp.]
FGIRERRQEAFSSFQAYSKALQSENYALAYKLSSKEFREATTLDTFADGQKQLVERFGKINKIRIDGYSVRTENSLNNWSATFTTTLIFERGETGFVFEMHRDRDTWKMFGLKQL